MRASSISLVTYLHLPPEILPATLPVADLRLANQGPKVWRARDLQDSQEGKPTETHTEYRLVLTRRPRPGLGQQPNSSLEMDLVIDMVNHLSKGRGIILC